MLRRRNDFAPGAYRIPPAEALRIADVTPDGAADGQAALNAIPGLAEKINTCHLHGLQRALLFSVGLAGASSKNPAAKSLLRKHSRV